MSEEGLDSCVICEEPILQKDEEFLPTLGEGKAHWSCVKKALKDQCAELSGSPGSQALQYKYCNHHRALTKKHQLVDFGDGEFVANKAGIPLLKALNEAGIRTRTHHCEGDSGFVSILLDEHIRIEIKTVNEVDADRTKYNGLKELLISW